MGEKLYLTEAGEVDVDVLNHARSRHAKQRHVRSTVHGGLFQRALAADQDPLVHEARLAEPVVNAAKKQHDVAVLARVHRLCDRSRVDRGLGVVRPRSIAVAVVVRVERGVLRRAFACASGWREVVSATDQKTTKLYDKKISKKKTHRARLLRPRFERICTSRRTRRRFHPAPLSMRSRRSASRTAATYPRTAPRSPRPRDTLSSPARTRPRARAPSGDSIGRGKTRVRCVEV